MLSASISMLQFHYFQPPSLSLMYSAAETKRRRLFFIVSDQNTSPSTNSATAFSSATVKSISNARESIKKYVIPSPPPTLTLDELPPLSDSQAIGVVAAGHAEFLRVIVDARSNSEEDRKIELLCTTKMVLKKMNRNVLVGDKVLVGSIDWLDQKGVVEDVFVRSSEITDPPAANIDHLLLLFSIKMPEVESFALTRFLVEAEADSESIPFTLAFNKIELATPEYLEAWRSRVVDWGYDPLLFSVEKRYGIDELEDALSGRTTILAGPSGVGKSSVINLLRRDDNTLDFQRPKEWFSARFKSKWFKEQGVDEVSWKNGRGKHTTRNTCMLPLSRGGYVVDTPGFSFPGLLKHTRHSLSEAFPEIRERLDEGGRCTFRNCVHQGEPGCVVKGDWERYPYYFQLIDEIKAREDMQMRHMGSRRKFKEEALKRFSNKYGAPVKAQAKRRKKGWRKRSRQKLRDWEDMNSVEDEEPPLNPATDGYLSDVFDFDSLDKYAASVNPDYI